MNWIKNGIILLMLVSMLTACTNISNANPEESTPLPQQTPTYFTDNFNTKVDWQYKGASLVGYWHDSYIQPNAFDQIDYLAGLGVNTIALVVTWYQEDMWATEIVPHFDQETATDENLREIIRYIKAQGIQVMLKPHLEPESDWLGNTTYCWRGVITPRDHALWFESYTDFILHYAVLAEEENVALFSIGTEMASMTLSQPDQARWGVLAEEVRLVYNQKLLYSAHEYEVLGGYYHIDSPEIEYVFRPLPESFWDHFDYAGTTVYYDIQNIEQNNQTTVDVDYLISGWLFNQNRKPDQQDLLNKLEDWQKSHGKKVIFSEIGYRSIDYAALHPYNAQGANEDGLSSEYNEQAQANAYEAAFRVWGHMDWLAGAFWWQFIPRSANMRECGSDVIQENLDNIEYTACGKEAASVLRAWFDGSSNTVPPEYVPELPDLLSLDTIDDLHLSRSWRDQSSGQISFSLDANQSYGNHQNALHILSNIPYVDENSDTGRYAQLDYLFSTEQDFSQYNSIMIATKTTENSSGEFTISIIDGDGIEWQSSRWLEGSDWQEISIALAAGSDQPDDPWLHPVDFVVSSINHDESEIEDTAYYELDLSEISGIRIKAFTTNKQSQQTPEFEVWIGEMILSEELAPSPPKRVVLPIIESFDYTDTSELTRYWQSINAAEANINTELINDSIRYESHVPCADKRYAIYMRRFMQPLDFSEYEQLEIQVKTIYTDEPWGGEFSILLWDTEDELWQSTRWIKFKDGWQTLTVNLFGNSQGDPFKHESDFVVPSWEQEVDGILDITQISAIGIKFNTVDDHCKKFPDMAGYIDDIILK